MPIPIIDLFAGPGGLGEGFSCFQRQGNARPFQIGLSIEKDKHAHRTLELRSFFRKFPHGEAPDNYYSYLSHQITREELLSAYPQQAAEARAEAWKAELGGQGYSYAAIDRRIERGLNNAEQWVLVGGPPCQAYSLAGRSRMKGEGEQGQRLFEQDRRHFLYQQYLRILAQHRPTVFVMENVKGILSSTIEGRSIFQRILSDLHQPLVAVRETGMEVANEEELSYNIFSLVQPQTLFDDAALRPRDYVVKSEAFGVPQARHRVFLVGVRSDVELRTGYLTPSEEFPSVEQVISDLPSLRSQISRGGDTLAIWQQTVREVETQQWLQQTDFSNLRDGICAVTANVNGHLTTGDEWLEGTTLPEYAGEWYGDPQLTGINHHITRGHLREDLWRYLFAAVYARVNNRSPTLNNFPTMLHPAHQNVARAVAGNSLFSDRFRVQVSHRASTTVTSHISKDGHYFIHPDPAQCRSLTVREAARLQTFPDNYFFEGPRTEQYKQVGNAVPPLLARQIAAIVYELFETAGFVPQD